MKLFVLALLLVSAGISTRCSSSARSQTTKTQAATVSKEPITDTEVETAYHYCKGITLTGKHCTRRVKNDSDYCFQHKIQANPCWQPKGSQPKEDCYYEDGDVTRPIPDKP